MNNHQLKIINVILFKEFARYNELNVEELPTNQFNYHVKELISNDYISKTSDGYVLTTKGKSLAGKIDIFSGEIEKQGKICVLPVCVKEENGIKKYLIHERRKQPSYGFIGFPSGKAKFGESLADEAVRELEEETGLRGTANLKQINHIFVKEREDGEIVDDKMFFIFEITNLTGEMMEETIEGINKWMTIEQIKEYDKVFPDVFDTIKMLENTHLTYNERLDIYTL